MKMIKVGKIVEVDYDYWGACHIFECNLCKERFNTYSTSTLRSGIFYMCGEGDDCPWCLEKYKPIKNKVKCDICTYCNKHFFDDHGEEGIRCECGAVYCSTQCSIFGNISNFGGWDQDKETHRIDNEKRISCEICDGNDKIKAICIRCNECLSVFYDMGEKTVWCKCGIVSRG